MKKVLQAFANALKRIFARAIAHFLGVGKFAIALFARSESVRF